MTEPQEVPPTSKNVQKNECLNTASELNRHDLSASRSSIYAWFAGIFAAEQSISSLECYCQGGIDPLLDLFSAIGLSEESERLRTAIGALSATEADRLELAADFAQLFLLDGKQAALPYASYYLNEDHQLSGPSEERMRYFLKKNHLQLHPDFREPADHVSVSLEVLSQWIAQEEKLSEDAYQEALKEEADFIDDALLSWLPQWAEKINTLSVCFDFYPAAVLLLNAFLLEDAAHLRKAA